MHLFRCSNMKRRRGQSSDSDKLAENWSFFDESPDELVFEILIRLPREAAVLCKAVCKRWCALISDGDYFITRFIHHRHHLLEADRPFSLVVQTNFLSVRPLPAQSERMILVQIISQKLFKGKLYEGIVDMRFIPCVQRPLPFQPMMHGPLEFQLEASCADLLLCSYNNPSTSLTVYHICNMVTRQWVALPPIRMDSKAADVGFLYDPVTCSVCNQGHTQSEFNALYNYRLVRIPLCRLFRVRIHSKLKIQIFSSKEGRWTNSVVPLPRSLRTRFGKSRMIAYNRMLHMLTDGGVIVFDPFRETQQVSRIIDLPVLSIPMLISSNICLGTSWGQLRLSIMSGEGADSALDVWELEDYKNGKWCMAYKISTQNLVFRGIKFNSDFCCCEVLAFHPNNRNIIYLGISKYQAQYVVQCDMQQKNRLKVLYQPKHLRGMCGGRLSWVNTFALVHHSWPTPMLSLA
ncbi:uncharacterized protein Fot_28690 [Forsythia ovata]|uniref:F-box domain-containing protein n=1 Tax=Forsythia ovata TaxID=205694 RepID=A0ABD1TPU6_9LAMI